MLVEKSLCTGCMACSNACKRAIVIYTDKEGFFRPWVDKNKCVECGMCREICPILTPPMVERYSKPSIVACAHKDEKVRLESASGGAFTAIAQEILLMDGVVFGAAMKGKSEVNHVEINDINEVHQLQKSKYVQSDMGKSLEMAKKYLDKGKIVLFSGLPCQVAGLYSFLNKKYENLYTTDLLCKGAPSPGVHKTFISYMEKKYKKKVEKYSFREKIYGWGIAMSVFLFLNKTKIILPLTQTSFGSAFSTDLILRPSCYNCNYRNIERVGDVSLGDFWGIGNDSELYNERKKGVSLLMINSKKGDTIFRLIKERMNCEKRTIKEVYIHSSSLKNKIRKNKFRMLFFNLYEKFPMMALCLFTMPHRTAVKIRDRVRKINI